MFLNPLRELVFLFTQQAICETLFRSWNYQVSKEFIVHQTEEDREVSALS